ncbi:MAG: hypothetical protein HOI53_09845 [Francisellaceae bacterium]|nr:hypothetical protein [Francisellaceae bacterium]MBT6208316.1 hypothetical protein [Francisellaceae bacterium]MBT6539847.1 hypothetical protein [Francisellaceae bacterium]
MPTITTLKEVIEKCTDIREYPNAPLPEESASLNGAELEAAQRAHLEDLANERATYEAELQTKFELVFLMIKHQLIEGTQIGVLVRDPLPGHTDDSTPEHRTNANLAITMKLYGLLGCTGLHPDYSSSHGVVTEPNRVQKAFYSTMAVSFTSKSGIWYSEKCSLDAKRADSGKPLTIIAKEEYIHYARIAAETIINRNHDLENQEVDINAIRVPPYVSGTGTDTSYRFDYVKISELLQHTVTPTLISEEECNDDNHRVLEARRVGHDAATSADGTLLILTATEATRIAEEAQRLAAELAQIAALEEEVRLASLTTATVTNRNVI